MNYGLYLAAGGTLVSMHRQDVLANNLANLNTVGFKPDDVYATARLPERIESGEALAEPQLLLEQLGGGTFAAPTRIDLRQGHLNQTHNTLDLAIQGEGFFTVSAERSVSAQSIRFTRDGRFTLNAEGELVMIATGLRVLDANDQPIRLDPGRPVQINSRGVISQNGVEVAQLQISDVNDRSSLVKTGEGLLRIGPGAGARRQTAVAAGVRQGFVESSAVDPILALNAMINASKSVQSNATMMQYHDHLLGQAITTMARVA